MSEDDLRGSVRSVGAELFVRAIDGEDGAMEALVDLASNGLLARCVVDVALELQVGAAQLPAGLPQPRLEVGVRLEDAVRAMIEAER